MSKFVKLLKKHKNNFYFVCSYSSELFFCRKYTHIFTKVSISVWVCDSFCGSISISTALCSGNFFFTHFIPLILSLLTSNFHNLIIFTQFIDKQINNIAEIRLDAYKMVSQARRPLAERVEDIGACE